MPKIRGFHFGNLAFKFDASKNLNVIYALRLTRDLISKMAIFFLPIFLYQQGSEHAFWNFLPGSQLQRGVLLLVLYYFVKRLVVLVSAIEIGKLTTKLGYQTSMLLGFCLFGLFLSFLYANQEPGWLILVSAVVNGLETNFFWNSYHTLFSKLTYAKHVGQNMGLLQFLVQISQAIAPALSGILIAAFGFSSLFMVGLIGVLICVILVLQLEVKNNRDQVSWAEFKTWAREKTFWRLAISQAGRHLNDITFIFWPLYVFLLLGGVEQVGFLYSLSLFLAMIFTFSIGLYIDNRKDKKPFYISGGLLSILWVLRSQVVSFWHVVIIDTIDRLTNSFYALFFDAIIMKRGKGGQAFSYFVYRQLVISVAAIIFWSLVGILFLIFESAWTALFFLPAIAVLFSLLVKEHHQD